LKGLCAPAKWENTSALDGIRFIAIYKKASNIVKTKRQRQLCRWASTYERHRMKELVLVMRAADAAARWHVDQRRKGSAQEPYLNHLLEVASLVTQATGGTDTDAVIAALLHDAVEDQGVTAETIAREFGQHVGEIVMEVTDDKSLPKADRKRLQIARAPHKSREAKLIKLADKTSNLRTIAVSPAADWSVERRLEYIDWAKAVVAGLRGTSPWLEAQFDEAAERATRSVDPLGA
jgi:(p)ppGpp synthase/HD superfamily hydrolase